MDSGHESYSSFLQTPKREANVRPNSATVLKVKGKVKLCSLFLTFYKPPNTQAKDRRKTGQAQEKLLSHLKLKQHYIANTAKDFANNYSPRRGRP